MRNLKLGISAIIAVVLIIIIFQNLEPVSTRLLFATVKMPRAALLFLTAIAGFVIGLIARFTFLKRE